MLRFMIIHGSFCIGVEPLDLEYLANHLWNVTLHRRSLQHVPSSLHMYLPRMHSIYNSEQSKKDEEERKHDLSRRKLNPSTTQVNTVVGQKRLHSQTKDDDINNTAGSNSIHPPHHVDLGTIFVRFFTNGQVVIAHANDPNSTEHIARVVVRMVQKCLPEAALLNYRTRAVIATHKISSLSLEGLFGEKETARLLNQVFLQGTRRDTSRSSHTVYELPHSVLHLERCHASLTKMAEELEVSKQRREGISARNIEQFSNANDTLSTKKIGTSQNKSKKKESIGMIATSSASQSFLSTAALLQKQKEEMADQKGEDSDGILDEFDFARSEVPSFYFGAGDSSSLSSSDSGDEEKGGPGERKGAFSRKQTEKEEKGLGKVSLKPTDNISMIPSQSLEDEKREDILLNSIVLLTTAYSPNLKLKVTLQSKKTLVCRSVLVFIQHTGFIQCHGTTANDICFCFDEVVKPSLRNAIRTH